MPEGLKYNIIRADKEGCPAVIDDDGCQVTFNDPTEASMTARKLSREMGEKLMVKLILNDKWKLREKARIRDGVYRPLPWATQDWWRSAMASVIHCDHFAHPSVEKPGWIAYTKTAEDGMRDKQTVVRPGSYLKAHFDRVMDYYGCSERRLVEQFMLAFGPIEVKFAETEDEIISVYEKGPPTCMVGRRWPTERNPAYLYACGDLQVAYLGDLNKASARAVVWPAKKRFSRVYGDIARITNGLERLGYKWGAPIGAKIQRVELRKVKFDPNKGPPAGCFLAPYIDKKNQAGGGHLSVIDKGTHLEICEEGLPGSHHCGLPDGYSGQYVPREDEYPTFTCDHCETPGFRQLNTVLTKTEDGDEESWCPKCLKRDAFHCQYSGGFFVKESTESIIVDGYPWAKYYADMYAAKCEATGELTNEGNLIIVYFADGKKRVNSEWARNHGLFKSSISRKYYLRDQHAVIYCSDNGRLVVGKPEVKYHAFQCDTCDAPWMTADRVQIDDKLYCRNCKDAPGLPLKSKGKAKDYGVSAIDYADPFKQDLNEANMQAALKAMNIRF